MPSTRFDWPGSWTAELPDRPGEEQIVALLSSDKFPEPELIDEVIRQGLRKPQPIVWVVRDRDKVTRNALDRVQQPYVLATLNPFFQWKYSDENTGDKRSEVRESELLTRCNRLILFTTPTTKTLDEFLDPLWEGKVRVIQRGQQAKKTYRKGKSLV